MTIFNIFLYGYQRVPLKQSLWNPYESPENTIKPLGKSLRNQPQNHGGWPQFSAPGRVVEALEDGFLNQYAWGYDQVGLGLENHRFS
jgi:hypothetical protein